MVETPQRAYEAGRQMRVPLMIGANSADFVGFISADTKEALFSQFGTRKADAIAAYDPDGATELSKLLIMAGTDRVQTEPARFTATAFVSSGAPAYLYRFSYVPVAMRDRWQNGVPHGAEIPSSSTRSALALDLNGLRPIRRSPTRSTLIGATSPGRGIQRRGPGEVASSRSRQERDSRLPGRRWFTGGDDGPLEHAWT
jgi:hypothetical protein